jgi:predicted phage terminase large subunit-like protein
MTTVDVIARSSLARRSLIDFAQLVYPRFEAPWHLRRIAGLLEDVESGRRRRLGIAVPVRHGKSVLSSQVFAAWYVGRNPERNVVLASHSEELAVRNSRIAKHLLEDDRWPFPDVQLSADSSSAGRWNVRQGGGCYAIGTGGAITGRGADVLVIDDALHDGLSENERTSVYRWYREVALPRVEPGGAVVVIGARFAEDDLIGQILDSEDAPAWEGNVISLPAIGDDGTALWPERYPLEELEMQRVAMGSRAFEAQFMQNPLSETAGTFKAAWMKRRYRDLQELVPIPHHIQIVQAIDGAWKTGVSNDFSVIATWGTQGTDFILLDVWRKRCEFFDLKRHVVEQYNKHQPHMVVVEEQASGLALLSELRQTTAIPIVGRVPKGAKEARAELVTPLFEAGKVVLPADAPWLDDWIREHLRFPGGAHDDQVDTTSLALPELRDAVLRNIRPRRVHRNIMAR